jgi:ATP-dependent exoDNAse (exonuclease V) alpha subunit
MIVARIAEHRSTWDRAEAEREVRAVLDVGPGKEWDGPVQRVLDAALVPEHTVSLGFVASVNAEARPGRQSGDRPEVELDAGREIFSTAAIVADERAMHEAARALAAQTRAPGTRAPGMPELRAPSGELDAQQRGAYACIAGGSGLAIVQGIAGAGKSRMLRDVATAYTDAGYRVLGAAVSGDAARVLGEEAEIATQTIARLRTNLGAGRERLDGRTVLLVDEASMLGTSDARELFEAARDGGAVVRLLGDAEQHGSVARGTVLADLSREHGAYDMALSRRAQEPWLREVAGDLRAGLTSRALGELREHGAIAEHRTTAEAKAALIDGWARDVLAERDVLLIATRRTDVADLNERARRALRERLGEERTYTTAFGERAFAIGEQLVARKADRASETVNGDRLRVLGHREDGRIACERVRDGAALVWDVKERPEIDYGYAATSYRSQGSTVDAVYVLATRADDRRGIYVDATRARQHVTIAYGRDEVENFGAMLALGAQERGERSVADRERSVSLHEHETIVRRQEIQQMAKRRSVERERGRGMGFGR